MIIGAHSIIYSVDPEADRAFLRDVLDFPSVDAGDGWLIFGLPPAELAIHPSEKNDVHEEPWGLLTDVSLPGGGKLGVYEALHERPPSYAGAG